jgi:DNA adenine methylase
LCNYLEKLENEYYKLNDEKRAELFYQVRKQFNHQLNEMDYSKMQENWTKRASQLIFMNRTCFNGLFRLNSKAEFNVPHGKYKNPMILDQANILAVSEVLQNVEIHLANYHESFDQITENSFVYFDPPYRPISKSSNFTSYSENVFGDKEQLELASFFKKIDLEKKAKLILSNSDPKNENPDDDFFDKAFADFKIHRVSALRAINSNGAKRGKINEIVVTNYDYI